MSHWRVGSVITECDRRRVRLNALTLSREKTYGVNREQCQELLYHSDRTIRSDSDRTLIRKCEENWLKCGAAAFGRYRLRMKALKAVWVSVGVHVWVK